MFAFIIPQFLKETVKLREKELFLVVQGRVVLRDVTLRDELGPVQVTEAGVIVLGGHPGVRESVRGITFNTSSGET